LEPHLRRQRKRWMALHTNSIAGSLKLLGLVPVRDPKGSPGLAPQCFRTSPKISPPSTHPRFPGVDAVRPLTGLRRTQYHLKCNACWPARKLLGLRDKGESAPRRRPRSNFTIAGEGRRAGGGEEQQSGCKSPIRRGENVLRFL
jgi:hypothetical protein